HGTGQLRESVVTGTVRSVGSVRLLVACGTLAAEGTGVLYYLLKYVLLGPWLRLIFRPQVEGRENVPSQGPAVIASHHLALSDSDEIQPLGRIMPKIKRVRIPIGTPLDFSRYAAMAGDRFSERAVTDEIMYELMDLSGREYVDVYAQKVKAQLAKAGTAGEPI